MKSRLEVLHAVILLLSLVFAILIGSAIIMGILLLLLSLDLIFSTVMKLKEIWKDNLGSRIYYCILLLLNGLLAIAAISVIVPAFMNRRV